MRKFPSQPVSIASALVLFAMLTLNLAAAFGQDNATRTYQCSSKDAVVIEDNGTLTKGDLRAEAFRDYFDQMIITVPSGHITYASSHISEDRVVQRTTVADDYVLIPSLQFRRKRTAANATTDFILLRTATGKPQATFVAFHVSRLVTGTCAIMP